MGKVNKRGVYQMLDRDCVNPASREAIKNYIERILNLDLAQQVVELEKEIKTLTTKKNRIIRSKEKRIKHLEWDNMVHRNAHSELYASMYSLRKELEEKGIETDWKY